MNGKVIGLVGLAIIIVPIALALLSGVPGLFGCPPAGPGYQSCMVFGVDIGGILSSMFGMGFVSIYTIPLGLVLIVIGGLAIRSESKRDNEQS